MLLIAVPAFLFYSFLLFQFLCTPASFEVHCSFLRCPHLFPAVRKEGTVVFFSREKNRLFSDSHLSESDFSLLSLSLSLSFSIWCFLSGSVFRCVSLSLSLYFVCFCQRLIAFLWLVPDWSPLSLAGRPVPASSFLVLSCRRGTLTCFHTAGKRKENWNRTLLKTVCICGNTRAKWQKRRREGGREKRREEKSGHLDLTIPPRPTTFSAAAADEDE